MSEQKRTAFEAAVIKRMKEGGFLEVEIRVECLGRDGDGYSDGSVDAYWHFWRAAQADVVVTLPKGPTTLPTGDLAAVAAANATHNILRECRKAIIAAGGAVQS